jgi:DNA-binding PadR family transcriptional regulator
LPKPQGSCGATKMKILAIIYKNGDYGQESYGYDIWKTMKDQFHIYLDDNDIGNVYHHLNDLCKFNYLTREDSSTDGKCFYRMTDEGQALRVKFGRYLEIMDVDEIG